MKRSLGCLRTLKYLCLLVILVMINCKNDTSSANKGSNVPTHLYLNDTLGFTISYPDGWEFLPAEQVVSETRKGIEDARKAIGNKYIDTWKPFLTLQKLPGMNRILGTVSHYNPQIHGNDYVKSRQTRLEGQGKMLKTNPGVTTDYQQVTQIIDNVAFENAQLTVSKNGAEVLWIWMYETRFSDDTIWLLTVMADSKNKLNESLNLIDHIKITKK